MAVCIQPQELAPLVSFSRIMLEPGGTDSMTVTVEIMIQEPDTGNPLNSFLDDAFFNQYLKIKLVQSIDPDNTNEAIRDQKLPSRGIDTKIREISISDILNGRSITEYRTVDTNGNISFNIRYQFSRFFHSLPEPTHLTYFVQSCYDMESLGELMELAGGLTEIAGPINHRRIFDNGAISGADNMSDTVVQDFRIVERVGKLDLFPNIVEDKLSRVVSNVSVGPRRNDRISSEVVNYLPDPGYFTALRLSQAETGQAEFQFSFNFKDLVFEKSVFGKYLKGSSPEIIDDILLNSQIKSMKINRRRVIPLHVDSREFVPGSGRRKLFDPSKPVDEIASTRSSPSGVVLSQETSKGNIREFLDAEDLSFGIRNFTGVDYDAQFRTAGFYEYSAEIEVQDYTVDYFAAKYLDLLVLAQGEGGLDEYINLLNIPKIYDRFSFRVREEHETSVVPIVNKYVEILSDFQVFTGSERRQILETFKPIASSLGVDFGNLSEIIVDTMLAITNPRSRDPQGVLFLQRLVNDLLSKMKVVIETAGSSILPKDVNKISSGPGTSSRARRVFTIHKTFSELLDKTVPRDVGYDYISLVPGPPIVEGTVTRTSDGLRVVDFEEMQSRLKSELSKHFSRLDLNIGLEGLEGEILPLDLSMETVPIVFAPSFLNLGGNRTSFLNQGLDMWDRDTNDALAARIMSFKSTGDLNNSFFQLSQRSLMNPKQQEGQYYLSNILEGFSITIIPKPLNITDCQDNLIPIKKMLSEDTFKAGTDAEQTKLTRTKNPEKRFGPVVHNILSDFTVIGGIQQKEIENRQEQTNSTKRFNFDILNPNSERNIFSDRVTTRKNKELVSDLPLQLKAFVASSMGSKDVIYDVSETKNPLQDLNKLSGFVFNYLLLCKVECLAGYKVSPNGRVMLQEPIWEIASLSKLQASKNSEILCKLTRYEDNQIPSISQGEGLDLPLYDEYFIVRKRT